MNQIFLGLGTNLGLRKQNLEVALSKLEKLNIKIKKISSLYETPALLPEKFDASWNMPFLNIAIQAQTPDSPIELLLKIKLIEKEMGREGHQKWAPRIIDIDILYFNSDIFQNENLNIPHPEIQKRHFVLGPLKELAPNFLHPILNESQLKLYKKLDNTIPQIMTIANITPDSFSDGGVHNNLTDFEALCNQLESQNIAYIDIGAESTRPGANPLSPEDEWLRLQPFLEHYKSKFENKKIKPKLSLDTRHPTNIIKATDYGLCIINDVSGFENTSMLETLQQLKDTSISYILMHNLGIPANPNKTLDQKLSVISEVNSWFEKKIHFLDKIGYQNFYLDPGIGFGKTPQQSIELLQNISFLEPFNKPILVGHSRKSFLKIMNNQASSNRDIETLGISFFLAQKKIDILRVHNSEIHKKALFAFSHCKI